MELKEIGPVSSAKVMGILYAGIGLIAGVLFACVALTGAALGNGFESTNPIRSGLFGVGAILVLPVVYGLLGALGGLILSGLYNIIARLVGGIQVTLQ